MIFVYKTNKYTIMKQFSLEEFKKNPNRKVVTRSGMPVRIVCTDKNGEYPVVALVMNSKNTEEVNSCKENGLYIEGHETNADLFFAPVKRNGWVNIYRDEDGFRSLGSLLETEEQAIFEINTKSDKYKHIATIKLTWEEE